MLTDRGVLAVESVLVIAIKRRKLPGKPASEKEGLLVASGKSLPALDGEPVDVLCSMKRLSRSPSRRLEAQRLVLHQRRHALGRTSAALESRSTRTTALSP